MLRYTNGNINKNLSEKDEKLFKNLLDKVFSKYLIYNEGERSLYLGTLVDKTHALNPYINKHAIDNLSETYKMSISEDCLWSEGFWKTVPYINNKNEKCKINTKVFNKAIIKHNKLVKMPGKPNYLKRMHNKT